jgi:leucyl-tRNA synthetase
MLHQTIKKVTEDLDNLNFNTAISQMMIFINHLQDQTEYDIQTLKTFLILLNPFAPHISEELNEYILKNQVKQISTLSWPTYDETLTISDSVTIAVQINGKTRGTIAIPKSLTQDKIEQNIINNEKLAKYFSKKEKVKVIYIPGRIINFILK